MEQKVITFNKGTSAYAHDYPRVHQPKSQSQASEPSVKKDRYLRISERRLEKVAKRIRNIFVISLILVALGTSVFGFVLGRAFPANPVNYDMVTTYTMMKGDTIWDVAAEIPNNPYTLKDTVDEILSMNGIYSPERIQVGKEITIPQW